MRILKIAFLVLLPVVGTTSTCSPATLVPTPSYAPATATKSPFPSTIPPPTSTPSLTPSLSSTSTAIPLSPTPSIMPGSVTGAILLVSNQANPFSTAIEVRATESFALVRSARTDQNGEFAIHGLPVGHYELWALINRRASQIPGCSDISSIDSSWRFGIQFGSDKAVTMQPKSLSIALMLVDSLKTTGLATTGIFAVSDFNIESSHGARVDLSLQCD
jgi:hypothetical protein